MKTISYYRGQSPRDLSVELIVPKFSGVSKGEGVHQIEIKVTAPDGTINMVHDEIMVKMIEPFKVKVTKIDEGVQQE